MHCLKNYFCLKSSKKLIFYLLCLIILLFLYYFVLAYKEKSLQDLYSLKEQFMLAEKFLSNQNYLEFSKKHLFKKEGESFEDFLQKKANELFIKDLKIEKQETTKIKQLEKTIYNIEGIFWHDSFIFQLLDDIIIFSPGFAKVTFLEIDRFSKISIQKPVLRMKIICELYSLK